MLYFSHMQQSNRIWCLKILAGSLVLLFLVNLIAMQMHFYYIFPWFDILTHVMGGFSLGVLSLIISGAWEGKYHSGHIILSILLVTLAGGIGWEAIEFNLDRFLGAGLQMGVIDTLLDIVMDLVGAFLAYGMLRGRLRKEIQN